MKKSRTDDTKEMIVKLLVKHGQLRYSEMKNKIGITDRAISNNLDFLVNEGTIESIKKGREKYYSLSKKAFDTWERRIDIFSSNYIGYLRKRWFFPNENESYKTPVQAYEDIGKKITAFYLYTLLRSLETGKNWIDAVDSKLMFEDLASVMLDFIFIDEQIKGDSPINHILIVLGMKGWTEFFEESKEMIKKNKNNKKVEALFNELKKLYPDEFKALKQSESEEFIPLGSFEKQKTKKLS